MKEKQRNKSTGAKRLLSLILTAAMAVTLLPAAAFPAVKAEAAEVTLSNPRIVEDSSMEAGQKVTWDCVWFGSYPQAEVVPSGEYTALDKSLLRDGDIIVSDSIYNALQSASGWDDNNEITLDGTKYRRMQQGDATHVDSYDSADSYRWSDSTTYHYFRYEPIKWRVLHTDGNQALLLSDAALDDQQYNTVYEGITWETSTIRSWLNGYDAESNQQSADYSQKNFIDSAFTASEQEAIIDSPVENADNIAWGTEGGNDTIDKIFLLSESEVCNTDKAISCGFATSSGTDAEACRSKSSTYAKAMGIYSSTEVEYAGNCRWWLRSPSDYAYHALFVEENGWVSDGGRGFVYNGHDGVRAALNLNLLSSNLYSYAGTVCSDGSKNEATKAEEPEMTLSNPRIMEDSSMEAGQKVTWDCVWFGSYPQAEVVPSGEYTALDEILLRDEDIIVSDSIYNALQSASGWDDNNEITLDGTKYRRMQQEEATHVDSYDSGDYYQWSDSTTYHYFRYEPIKWRVLHTDGNQALLLSDAALDNQQYNTVYEGITWETSTIRSWLNGYGAESNHKSEDYSQKNFIDSAFTASEQAAIIDSPVENADNITYGTDGGSDTIDKVFLLSESEVWNTDRATSYGFVTDRDTYDEARRSESSTYAKAMGICSDLKYNCWWWLRSPGSYEDSAMIVGYAGQVIDYGYDVDDSDVGVRAALNLNLSSSNLYSYAGTVCYDENKNGPTIPGDSTVLPNDDITQVDEPTITVTPTPVTPTPETQESHVDKTFAVNGLQYKVTKDDAGVREVCVISLQKNTKTLKIPATVTNSAWKETFKVTSVKAKAFKGKNITKAVIGKNVTKIGSNAFLNCKKLKRVTIGKSVKTIGVKAFYDCRTLKKVTIKSTALKNVKKNAFKRISAKAVIKVPKSKKKEYTRYLKGKTEKGVKVK